MIKVSFWLKDLHIIFFQILMSCSQNFVLFLLKWANPVSDIGNKNSFVVCTFVYKKYLWISPYLLKWLARNLLSAVLCTRTTDTQWRHKSKISEKLGQCGRQNMLRVYLKIWDWDWIFGREVKAISSLGVCNIQPLELDRLLVGSSRRFVETRLRVYQDLKFRRCKQREIPACDSRN